MTEETTFPDDSLAQVIEETKLRILHALKVFPFISASMLHQAIGTATPGKLWRPILEGLVEDGKIEVYELSALSPTGRMQAYTIYHLPSNEYPNSFVIAD